MLARHEHIVQAVDDPGRNADLRHIEAPRLDQTEGVVDIAPDAVTERFVDPSPNHFVPLGARHDGTVSLRELHLVADHLGGIVRDPFEHRDRHPFDLTCEDIFALQRPANLLDVHRVHTSEPIEARNIERRDPRSAGGSRHPLGQTRSNRKAVRAPQEPPITANRSIPRLSAIAETSATQSTTRRPRRRSEPVEQWRTLATTLPTVADVV